MTEKEIRTGRLGDALAAHARECADCLADPPPVDRIAWLLAASRAEVDVTALSQRTLGALRPELGRLARTAFWRQVAVAVALALLPLPAIVVYNTVLLTLAYDLLSSVLPGMVATYLVCTEAAMLLLLWGATYGAIPVLVARNLPRRITVYA